MMGAAFWWIFPKRVTFDTQIGDDNDDDSGVIASEPKPVKLELALRIKSTLF